jgi:ethanolamine utilization protein EutM
MPKALGLVETRGLVAAIEAADAMVKAANVILIGKEKTDPALITVKIVGETAAVKSAVDAGASAAKRVGELVSIHIIPQPDEQMITLLPEIEEDETRPTSQKAFSEPSPEKVTKTKTAQMREKKSSSLVAAESSKIKQQTEPFTPATETIERLRKEALGTGTEREKKETAKPSKLTKKSKVTEDIENMNVHELRRYARSIEGFPIQGRQISIANKKELIEYFRSLK